MSALGDIFTIQLLLAALRLASPIALVALGETFSERAGIINVGVEGTASSARSSPRWSPTSPGTPGSG